MVAAPLWADDYHMGSEWYYAIHKDDEDNSNSASAGFC
jgi:hypothetical protein